MISIMDGRKALSGRVQLWMISLTSAGHLRIRLARVNGEPIRRRAHTKGTGKASPIRSGYLWCHTYPREVSMMMGSSAFLIIMPPDEILLNSAEGRYRN